MQNIGNNPPRARIKRSASLPYMMSSKSKVILVNVERNDFGMVRGIAGMEI